MADLLWLLVSLLMVITLCFHPLCASDQCNHELTRLKEQEKLLKSQLQQQDLLLRRLRLLNQAANEPNTAVDHNLQTQHQDCSQLYSSGVKSSGFYSIQPRGAPAPVRVYCDMSEGGGWTVMQRRINGAENFTRSWVEYKNGFGNMVADLGELWLGNDNLHYITTQGNYTLTIHLEDFDGNQRHAEYRNFKVADEKDFYRLTFGAYTGTAGDALSGNYQAGVSDWASHQGLQFSTYDKDNDNYQGSCAQEDKGGWWFNKCHSAHLNGRYYPSGYYSGLTDDGVVWYTWRGWWYSLKTSIMKLRPDNFKIKDLDDPNMVHKA
ncbi:fibrinogen-like protein 1 [Dunckerocampus dactyliophorus]|uniref:fibrinogen-like protein 1 n=1 Tax=Dunckerocampus dactyliophorus TaxID=161453 RepID=UPI0024056E0B|nr:fibrinogen-like protein 1 [Dunckerocampus dactyliophorus]